MELRFTPRRVKEIEDRLRRPITEVLSSLTMSNVAIVVEKAAGLDNENQALDAIEEHLNAGNDFQNLVMDIMEKLQAAGFLPKAIRIDEMRERMNNPEMLTKAMDEVGITSVNNG